MSLAPNQQHMKTFSFSDDESDSKNFSRSDVYEEQFDKEEMSELEQEHKESWESVSWSDNEFLEDNTLDENEFYPSLDLNSSPEPVSQGLSIQKQGAKIDVLCPVRFQARHGKIMDCASLGLTAVPRKPPPDIIKLDLFNNSISTLENDTFCNYMNLTTLFLTKNNLTSLEVGSFNCLTQLKYLYMKYNKLVMKKGTFPPGVFKPLKNLLILKINRNTFSKIWRYDLDYPDTALQDLTKLKSLFMDGLDGRSFGAGFAKMKSLRNLTLAGYSEGYCKLERIKEDCFQNLTQITFLNISDCYIMGRSLKYKTLEPLRNLEVLDLTYNVNIGIQNLTTLLSGLRNSSLKKLFVSSIVTRFSRGIEIDEALVKSLPRSLEYLVAKENCFETIAENVFDSLPENLSYIDLGNNRLLFGKYLKNLSKLGNLQFLQMSRDTFLYDLPSQYPFQAKFHMFDHNSYSLPPNIDSSDPFILKLPPKLTRVEMNTAGLIYFLTNLTVEDNNSLTELSIAKNYFPKAIGPISGLKNLHYLDLSHCSLAVISTTFFQYFPSLNTLKISYNNLKNLLMQANSNAKIFRNLTKLKYLDLSYNRLTNLSVDIFEDLSNLEKLHLESNQLSEFNLNISHMTKLKVLNLNDSQLPTLPINVRQHIDYLKNVLKIDIFVDMSINPIHCDCQNLDFLQWMVNSKAFDHHFRRYRCEYPDLSSKTIEDGYAETIQILERKCAENYPIFLVVLGATLALVVMVTVGIAYRFRWKIRYLYYAAYLKLKKTDQSDDQHSMYKYDVFLSYSHSDEPFVLKELMPELQSRGLKIHVHGRDFAVGEYIASNIAAAVINSRKTLAILTRGLLSSHWCNYELQMANNESIDTGRPVLVFLIKDPLSIDELGRELLNHIRCNTYTSYPSNEQTRSQSYMQMFWDKLAHDLKQ
ncbi:TLR cluster3 member 10 [Biomphalaria glabrata]